MQNRFARTLLTAAVGFLAVLVMGTRGAIAAPLTNMSFETPSVGTTADRIDVAAGTFISGTTGWQAVNVGTNTSAIAIYSNVGKNSWPTPSDGHQLSTLNSNGGTGKGGIQQAFDTVVGQAYTMTFDYSAIADGTAHTNVQATYEVDDGATAATAIGIPLASGTASTNTPASSLAFPAYQHLSLNFTALSTTTTVRFLSSQVTGGNAFGPVVDNVQVTATPEPSALMALAGVFVVGLVRRRRAR